jgi:hypothetical protein
MIWGDKSIPTEKKTDFGIKVSGKEYAVVPVSQSTNQHTTGVRAPGYYINPNDTIGGRQVYLSTDLNALRDFKFRPAGNLLDRNFECRQPVWKVNCM